MNSELIGQLRENSRKLVRELGLLQISKNQLKKTPQHWHALIEIKKNPRITISRLSELLLITMSSMSRIVSSLEEDGYINYSTSKDKREKYIQLTSKGEKQIVQINDYSNSKIKGAFQFLSETDKIEVLQAIKKYAEALEKSRIIKSAIKINKISTSRAIRKQIVSMITEIQRDEYKIPIDEDTNSGILKAEEEYYYQNSYNFWYATNSVGEIIGSIGLKSIDSESAEIKKFFVTPFYRGKGVAIDLMKMALKSAEKHSFKTLYLGTVDKLQAAQNFYKKYGFQEIKQNTLPEKFKFCHLDTNFFGVSVSLLREKIDNLEP